MSGIHAEYSNLGYPIKVEWIFFSEMKLESNFYDFFEVFNVPQLAQNPFKRYLASYCHKKKKIIT